MNCKECIHWQQCFGQDEICSDFMSNQEYLHKVAGLRNLDEIEKEIIEVFEIERK